MKGLKRSTALLLILTLTLFNVGASFAEPMNSTEEMVEEVMEELTEEKDIDVEEASENLLEEPLEKPEIAQPESKEALSSEEDSETETDESFIEETLVEESTEGTSVEDEVKIQKDELSSLNTEGSLPEEEIETGEAEEKSFNEPANKSIQIKREPGVVDVKITSFKILTEDLKEAEEYHIHSNKKILISWDATHLGATILAGDYFDVTLPEEFSFPSGSSATHFDLIDPNDGVTVIAKAVVTPKETGGGNIRVTFTDKVENKENVKGSMYLASTFIQSKVKAGEENTFKVIIGSYSMETTIKIGEIPTVENEYFTKWGRADKDDPNKVNWLMRINAGKGSYSNVIIEDTLLTDNEADMAGIELIPGSFLLDKVEMNKYGAVTKIISSTDISDSIIMSTNKKSFKYILGDISEDDQYRLYYASTYTPGITLKNKIHLEFTGDSFKYTYSYHSASSGGEGSGDLLGKIKIIKHDARDEATLLKGAIFTVTRKSDNEEFRLTTDEKGEAVSAVLTPGEYTIKEIKAPDGYLLNADESTVTVKYDEATIVKIPNHMQKHLAVWKKWVGPELESVTVNLLANGHKVDSVVLSKALNDWKHGFKGLRKYDDSGKEIIYTFEEVAVDGYSSVITGEGDYYTITNTETMDIPVEKQWVGAPTDNVKIYLLADGNRVAEANLNPDNQWKYTFEKLPKYNSETGKEISYSLEELGIDGYTSVVTCENGKGLITNISKETISLPVIKAWIGRPAEEAVIKLLADGEKVDEITLNAEKEWNHVFKNLPKYSAVTKKEIVYTLEEVKVKGYSTEIFGSSTEGFIVINTNREALDIPVEKKWIGPAADEVRIKLLADGKVVDEVLLNKANSWKHSFMGFLKYNQDSGEEITYSLEEVGIDGYSSKITGSVAEGFVVTNFNQETIKIPVEKVWEGPEEKEVNVQLLGDGKQVKEVTLTKAENWKYIFTNLPKFDSISGKEIVYSLTETPLKNYTTKISGNAKDGFTITNTNTEKVDVAVKKVWEGQAAEKVTLILLADGVKKEEIKISAKEEWKHLFKDLPKYDTKTWKEIKYTIEEVKLEGYSSKVTGSVKDGFTVTNTKKPVQEKPKLPGTGSKDNYTLVFMGLILLSLGYLFMKRRKFDSK